MSAFLDDKVRWGLARAAYRRLMTRLRPFVVVCRIHVRQMKSDPDFQEDDPELPVRILSREELLRACGQLPRQLDRDFVEAAFSRGDFCVGAFHQDRLVAFVWRSFTCAPHEDGLWVRVEKPSRYGYKAFTLPEYRGRHLMSRLAVHSDRVCVERGYTYAVGFIETHNFPSIKADLRHGNRLVGYAGYFRWFGRSLPFRTSGARRFGFRFFRHGGRAVAG